MSGEIAATWEDINSLVPWGQNPRHNDQAIQSVVDSIKRFGFGAPIVAREADKMVIAGHTRLEAARRLGLDKVPVRYLDLDPADAKMLALADNKIGEIADWDSEALEKIIDDLGLSVDDMADLGWNASDLDSLFESDALSADAGGDGFVADEQGDTCTQSILGDIYRLGDHVLVCGDWRDVSLRESAFGIVSPTAAIHDPPYGISAVGKNGQTGAGSIAKAKKYIPIFEDDKPFDPTELISIVPRSIVWGANNFSSKLPSSRGWIVWDKKCQDWRNTFSDGELAWTSFDKVLRIYRHLWMGLMRQGFNKDTEYERCHPTQKPVALIEKIIEDYLIDDGVIADFFLGSGTTLIACAQKNKKCLGFEIEPKYCDVIRRRWFKYATEHNLDVGDGLDG